MDNFSVKYDAYQNKFNVALQKYFDELKTQPSLLGESMRYSAMLGGKRIRPVLMYAIGDMLNVNLKNIEPFALSLELIHTYSLIHDDMPEMDNDDFRRGQPSNHKVFGQANALLAGDGLLNSAYSNLFNQCYKGSEYISAAKFICDCAGVYGMIAGQSADINTENYSETDESKLEYIYENKTCKLIMAATVVPTILKSGKYYSEMKLFGKKLGYLFQLTDDILDATGSFDKLGKTTGKDEAENKFTAIKMYGLDNCRLRVDVTGDDCHRLLDCIPEDCDFLHDLVNFIKSRLH